MFYIPFLLLGTTLNALSIQEQLDGILQPKPQYVKTDNINDWSLNPHISQEERRWITPHLMPNNHPIRKKLDKLFKNARVTSNEETMKQAGFTVFQSGSKTRVASHPNLIDNYGQKYLIKFHYDNDLTTFSSLCLELVDRHLCRHCPSWKQLINRVMGAKKVEKAIAILGYNRFVVPKKWLYPLPEYPYKRKEGHKRKNYLLVVERLKLYPHEANKNLWKTYITKEMLRELYTLMSIGLGDISHENACFTKSGEWALIDSECCFWGDGGFDLRPHPGQSLNPEMAAYWKGLCESNEYHYRNLY